MKITLITATYNAEKYLEDCILSILNQSYDDYEYIIIDGGSNDKTIDIIKKYENYLAYWISEPDKGIYDAWNKGLLKANGKWIAFIGSDDLLYPNALKLYVEHINKHSNQRKLEFVSSRIELVSQNLLPIRVVGEPWSWNEFKKEMITWHVGTFHSKVLFDKYGLFDVTYKISGDYEFLLRAKDSLVTSFINDITARMRVGGVSNMNLSLASAETYRAKINNKVLSSTKGRIFINIDKFRLYIRKLTGWKNF